MGRPSSARNPWAFEEEDCRPTDAHVWERVSEKNGKAEILYEYYIREMDLLQPSMVIIIVIFFLNSFVPNVMVYVLHI